MRTYKVAISVTTICAAFIAMIGFVLMLTRCLACMHLKLKAHGEGFRQETNHAALPSMSGEASLAKALGNPSNRLQTSDCLQVC